MWPSLPGAILGRKSREVLYGLSYQHAIQKKPPKEAAIGSVPAELKEDNYAAKLRWHI